MILSLVSGEINKMNYIILLCCVSLKLSFLFRFHQLAEFDLEKRSCRRRLACHNERRRKPQATTAALLASGYSRIAPSLYG